MACEGLETHDLFVQVGKLHLSKAGNTVVDSSLIGCNVLTGKTLQSVKESEANGISIAS